MEDGPRATCSPQLSRRPAKFTATVGLRHRASQCGLRFVDAKMGRYATRTARRPDTEVGHPRTLLRRLRLP